MKGLLLDLPEYLDRLWRRRALITLCVAVAASSALGFSLKTQPIYEATAKLFIGPRDLDPSDPTAAMREMAISGELVASYAEILKSRRLAELVIQETNAPISAKTLVSRVKTEVLPETRLIEVSVTDRSPKRAQQYANGLVDTFVEDPQKKFGGATGKSTTVLDTALEPDEPISPKPLRSGAMGATFGLLFGIGSALLLEHLNTAIRTRQDAERALAPIPVVAQVPFNTGKKGRLFVFSDPDSPQAESLRILRTNVQFFSPDDPVKVALVTSPLAAEGKTTVAANLAASMAATGSVVLLIETDLRKPMLSKVFNMDESPGLSNVLARQIELRKAIQETPIPNLYLLTAGSIPPNPSELLGGEVMVKVINAARSMADVVILDSSPALPVTDTSVLAPHTDGVLLVVRSGRTSSGKAKEVVANFKRHDVRMLGVILNGIERDSDDSTYYGYRYYKSTRSRVKLVGKSHDTDNDDRFLSAPQGPASRRNSRLGATLPMDPETTSSIGSNGDAYENGSGAVDPEENPPAETNPLPETGASGLPPAENPD